EVEVVLVNGESVDFRRQLKAGDRVAVYPQFEALDVTALIRVREKPLRRIRFVADAHLGLLAKYLRILGFDTVYARDHADAEIAALAAKERRVVLTRDRDLLMHRRITHGVYIRFAQPKRQLAQVVDRLDLAGSIDPFSRCLECNEPLTKADERTVAARVPPGPRRLYDRFYLCRACDRVYWQGSHYRHMQRLIDDMLETARQASDVR
ncbi:MAG: Mut7-C RNAse domain-containing protein, partial [Gammaproteobacteria bacterium]|nr:Mut7-C RNAse domain-containing protein [Gammaproteobacteria bacterium]